ncbi:MAG: AAA family ATPase, partial [Planctomycetaceae bacterium]|nr:AAA family ATPase [Planctomycetaceae bacterium]
AVSCERGQGIGVLTGEAGLGKSLVGLRLAFELQPSFATVFLGHSAYATRRALLQAILFELNRPYDRKAEQELRLELTAALKSLRSEKQGFVLIVDEAHRLSVPLLDEVRLLTLLAESGNPLARVVLIGDRELEERLADPELAAFNQRVSCQVDLAALTQVKSLEYLSAHLESAGGEAEEIFTEEALVFLAKAADGVPRCLNHLADHALLLAYVTERRPVSAEIVREALDDLKQLPLHWNDPISGGEIYRGLSQRPPMEDSAVDLWPQREQTVEDDPRETNSWDESAFGGSSAAIEIGGELDEPATEPQQQEVIETEQLTCLKENWQAITRPSSSVEELLESVAELTQAIEDEQAPPTLGQIFDAREFEFGAPSPQSFAVEEFAAEDSDSDFGGESHEDHWTPQADDDDSEPVWNLPDRSWSVDDDRSLDFEEEPVIDRYVRIASGEGIVWNHHIPHTRVAKRTVTAVKTTRLVMAAAGLQDEFEGTNRTHESDESHQPRLQESDSSVCDSGIVESYSRKPRDVGQVSNLPIQDSGHAASEDHELVQQLPQEKQDWHLPTELLQATLEDDGIEEQIGAELLDMYLDVQQSLLDQRVASARQTRSFDKPKAEELPPAVDEFETHTSIEGDDRPEPPRATIQPDAIQRAYGRMFSELRRRKK